MYLEPHLNEKSDECAAIWREWFDTNYNLKDKEKAKILRKEWCQCCTEFGELISKEVRENPRYNELDPKTIRRHK